MSEQNQFGKPEWRQFGDPIGLPFSETGESRWFHGEPVIDEREVKTFAQSWPCPVGGCEGEMIANGMTWPMNPPGYHHTCNQCSFTAALSNQQFPRTVTR